VSCLSTDKNLSFLRFAGGRRETVFGPDSQQAFPFVAALRLIERRRSIGAAIILNSPFFAPAFAGQGRGEPSGGSARFLSRLSRPFALERQLPG